MATKKIQICIWLKEMVKVIQGLKTEFSKDINILKRTQDEMKIKLKNSVTQLENSGGKPYE